MQYNFLMGQLHLEHMQKFALKYVKGLSADANSWDGRTTRKCGSIANVCRQIEYYIRHGVTKEKVL
ncbi:MAG TPA: hypothetical protein VGJ42_05070 [Nitrososphaera sp.]